MLLLYSICTKFTDFEIITSIAVPIKCVQSESLFKLLSSLCLLRNIHIHLAGWYLLTWFIMDIVPQQSLLPMAQDRFLTKK